MLSSIKTGVIGVQLAESVASTGEAVSSSFVTVVSEDVVSEVVESVLGVLSVVVCVVVEVVSVVVVSDVVFAVVS